MTDLERKLREGAVRYISVLVVIIVVLLIVIVFLWSKPDTTATGVEKTLAIVNIRIAELERNMKNNLSAIPILKQELEDSANKSTLVKEEFDEYRNTSQSIQNKTTEDLENLTRNLPQQIRQEIEKIVENLRGQIENVTKAKEEANALIKELKENMEVVKMHIFNKEALKMAIGFILVLLFTLAFFVYNLYVKDGGKRRVKSASGVIDQIPRNPTLENSVCMVCFKSDKGVEYSNLLSRVCDTPFKQFFVNRHENLIEIPPCRLYVMFVEFSERHVIIEEPGLGLGSLKRCTHDAVAKLGGTLIIIYTRDPGSRTLSEDRRYNTNIYCVSHQPELISLRDAGRFFSIYDRFTQTQLNGLRDCIRQYVR